MNESMEILKNKEGEEIAICSCQQYDTVWKCLKKGDNKVTPYVADITYDPENEVFLIREKIMDKYPDERPSTIQANLYYYVNFDGTIISPGYTDFLEGFFQVDQYYDAEIKEKDQTAHQTSIANIEYKIGAHLDHRKKHHDANAKKLLLQ